MHLVGKAISAIDQPTPRLSIGLRTGIMLVRLMTC